MSRWAWPLVPLLLVLSSTLARSAHAEITRYAVVVGNDRGAREEGRLRYAEADARKVYDVLQALGEFRPENMVLLQGLGASELQRVLISMNARIRAEASGGAGAILFVYFSGHADAQALHLGLTRMELGLLERLVQGSSADYRILALDACRSGALTRVKGAKPTAPFAVSVDASLPGEGVAFLTAAAADEDAQESDELRGSFFTHYLVSGLRGAADRDQNGAVSVEEAYAYAYEHTLRASSQTLQGLQHPTFRFDLKGKGAVPLTWVSHAGPRGGLMTLPPGRAYLLFAGSDVGPVAAEVGEHDRQRRLALEPGRYFVRGRARDHLLEGVVELAPGQVLEVRDAELERVEYARLARKGGGSRPVHGPWLGYQLRSALWSEASLCHGPRAGYALDLPSLTLSAGVGACRSHFANDLVSVRADELGIDVAASHVIDFPPISLGLGAAVGLGVLHQSFDSRGLAPSRDSLDFSVGGLASISADLASGYYLFSDLFGQLHVFAQQRGAGSRAATAVFTLRPVAGVGKRF